jgi:Holliday junction resolvase
MPKTVGRLCAKRRKPKGYLKGRQREHSLKRRLERAGWLVVRSAGSKGVFDLIAIKDVTIGLQVKGSKPTRRERLRIAQAIKGRAIIGLVAILKGRTWQFYEVDEDGSLQCPKLNLMH